MTNSLKCFQPIYSILALLFMIFTAIGFLWPKEAYGNVGIPLLLSGSYILMPFALLPVILLEAFIFERQLRLRYKKVILSMGGANLFSTIVGCVITIILSFAVQSNLARITRSHHYDTDFMTRLLRILSSGGILITRSDTEFYWLIPILMIVGMVLAFFLSVGIEGVIFLIQWSKVVDKVKILKLTWKANMASYSFMLILYLVLAGFGVIR